MKTNENTNNTNVLLEEYEILAKQNMRAMLMITSKEATSKG